MVERMTRMLPRIIRADFEPLPPPVPPAFQLPAPPGAALRSSKTHRPRSLPPCNPIFPNGRKN